MKKANIKEAKILFIAYYFPPAQSIGVWRNYYLAKECKKFFMKVFVSGQTFELPFSEDKTELEAFDRIQNSVFDYRFLFRNRQKIGFKEGFKKNYISQFFIKLINSFPFNIIFGEGGLIYLFQSFFHTNKFVKKEGITFIYSSFRPMTDHIIAYMLKSRNPNVVWTADFRDLPFDPLYKNYFWYWFQKAIMRKIFSKADHITTFNNGIGTGLKQYTEQDILILENGPFVELNERITCNQNSVFTIQYTGSLFLNERDPKPLFEALQELIVGNIMLPRKVKLKYAGKDDNQWRQKLAKFQLSEISEIQGMVDYRMARLLQTESHINVILTSSHQEYTGIITGKFFEYISAGRPIICLVNGKTDRELEQIFDKYHLGIVVYTEEENKEKLKNFLSNLYEEFEKTGSIKWQINPNVFDDFNWTKTVQKWVKKLANDKY